VEENWLKSHFWEHSTWAIFNNTVYREVDCRDAEKSGKNAVAQKDKGYIKTRLSKGLKTR
jgi:hypothetical protein